MAHSRSSDDSFIELNVTIFLIKPFNIIILTKSNANDQQLATNTLERVAPLTHAVGNVLKRVFVIGFSIVIFGMSYHRLVQYLFVCIFTIRRWHFNSSGLSQGTRFQHKQALAPALPLLASPSTRILRQRWKRRKE